MRWSDYVEVSKQNVNTCQVMRIGDIWSHFMLFSWMLYLIGINTFEMVLLSTLLSVVTTKSYHMKVVDSGETAAVPSVTVVVLRCPLWQSFLSAHCIGFSLFLFFVVCFWEINVGIKTQALNWNIFHIISRLWPYFTLS